MRSILRPGRPSPDADVRGVRSACSRRRGASLMLRRADEPTEDCSSGAPASGNADCAGVLLPFWSECGSLLDEQSAVYLGVVAECQASAGVGVGSDDGLVHVFERLLCNTSQQALTRSPTFSLTSAHTELLLATL